MFSCFSLKPENRIWYFMQTASTGDNLHEMSKSVSWENKRKISNCHLILPRMLSIKEPHFLIDKDIFAFQSDIKSLLKIYSGKIWLCKTLKFKFVTVSDMTSQSPDKICHSSDNICHSSCISHYLKTSDQWNCTAEKPYLPFVKKKKEICKQSLISIPNQV